MSHSCCTIARTSCLRGAGCSHLTHLLAPPSGQQVTYTQKFNLSHSEKACSCVLVGVADCG